MQDRGQDGSTFDVQRLEARVKALEQQKSQLSVSISDLRRELFTAREQPNQLALDLGFDSIQSLVTHVETNAHIWNKAAIEWNASHIAALEADLRRKSEVEQINAGSQLRDVEHLKEQLERARSDMEATKEDVERARAKWQSEVTTLKEESLRHLESFEQMKNYRDRLQARWELELGLRKKFADHIEGMRHLSGSELELSVKKLVEYWARKNAKQAQLRADVERPDVNTKSAPSTSVPKTPRKQRGSQASTSPLAKDVTNTRSHSLTPTRPRVHSQSSTSAQSSPSKLSPGKRKRSDAENEMMPPPIGLDESQTQNDSQMPTQFDPDASIRFTPKKRVRPSQPSSAPPTTSWRQHSATRSLSSLKQRSSPETSHKLARVTSKPSKHAAEQSKSSTKPKRRGRYSEPGPSLAKEDGSEDMSEYELNPDANFGLNYQFNDVVRKKQDRRTLVGEDCDQCRDYYEALGPMPPRLQPPLWRSPPSSPSQHSSHDHHHDHHHSVKERIETTRPFAAADDDLADFNDHQRQRGIVAHKQEISRHRADWPRSKTPPSYWDIGFPDTQQTKEINARAAKMREEKEAAIRREARKENGKFRKKKRT